MTRRGWLIACSSILGTVGIGTVALAISKRWRKVAPATPDFAAETELFQLINAERARLMFRQNPGDQPAQVPPLSEDTALRQVAQVEAENMGRRQGMIYIPEEQLKQELREANYPFLYMGVVQSVVFGFNWKDAVASWMKDPKHQADKNERLMNPNLLDVGIGVYKDSRADAFYVFVLLAKKHTEKKS